MRRLVLAFAAAVVLIPLGGGPAVADAPSPGFSPGMPPGFEPGMPPGYQPGSTPGYEPGMPPGSCEAIAQASRAGDATCEKSEDGDEFPFQDEGGGED